MSIGESESNLLWALSNTHYSLHEHPITEPWEVGVKYYIENICICSYHKSTENITYNHENNAHTHPHTKHIAWLTKIIQLTLKIQPEDHQHVSNMWSRSIHALGMGDTDMRVSGTFTNLKNWLDTYVVWRAGEREQSAEAASESTQKTKTTHTD